MTTPKDVASELRRRWNMPWGKLGIGFGGLAVISLILLCLFRVLFVDWVDNYQIGYMFDARNGKITVLPHTGYVVTLPFVVKVHHIDKRPMQVCISAIQRVLNCKLVQFNSDDSKAVELFLSWHGRKDYDGPGTSSSQSTSGASNYTYFQSVLLNYAYDGSGKDYPFLTVLRELKPDEKSTR